MDEILAIHIFMPGLFDLCIFTTNTFIYVSTTLVIVHILCQVICGGATGGVCMVITGMHTKLI